MVPVYDKRHGVCLILHDTIAARLVATLVRAYEQYFQMDIVRQQIEPKKQAGYSSQKQKLENLTILPKKSVFQSGLLNHSKRANTHQYHKKMR